MRGLAGYGLLCTLGNILLMRAAFRAPAARIGPTQYSQMLWAILIDTFVFHIHLELTMLLGIVLIVGACVLTLWREKARGTPLPHSVAADGQGLRSSDEGEGSAGFEGRLVPAGCQS